MANAYYERGSSFNPDELADGDAIEAEFDAVVRGFDTIETQIDTDKAGYPTQTFHVAPASRAVAAWRMAARSFVVLGNRARTDELNRDTRLNRATVRAGVRGLDLVAVPLRRHLAGQPLTGIDTQARSGDHLMVRTLKAILVLEGVGAGVVGDFKDLLSQ